MMKWSLGLAVILTGLAAPAPGWAQYLPGAAVAEPVPIDYGGQPQMVPGQMGGPPAQSFPGLYPNAPNAFKDENKPPPPCPPAFHVGFEYLLWYIKPTTLPPLVTTGNINDNPPGALGQPGTQVLIGGNTNPGAHSGFRLSTGYWFDDQQTLGIDASGFILERRSNGFSASSDGMEGSPILARPFFDPNVPAQNADPIALTDVQSGSVVVSLSDRLWGGEVNLCYVPPDFPYNGVHWTLLAGGRYLALDEKLGIFESIMDLPNGGFEQNFLITDEFITRNQFYGGQVGARLDVPIGPFNLGVVSKLALGTTDEVIKIRGTTLLTNVADGSTVFSPNQGLLAQPTNVGRFHRQVFAVVPEVGGTVSWNVNQGLRLYVGYSFLYWSRVARPVQQIDPAVNVQALNSPVAPPFRPLPTLSNTDFYVDGINIGVELSF